MTSNIANGISMSGMFYAAKEYLFPHSRLSTRGLDESMEILGDGFREFNGIPRSFYSKKFGMCILLVGSEGKIFRMIDF